MLLNNLNFSNIAIYVGIVTIYIDSAYNCFHQEALSFFLMVGELRAGTV